MFKSIMSSIFILLCLARAARASAGDGDQPNGSPAPSPSDQDAGNEPVDGRSGESFRELLREEPDWSSLAESEASDKAVGVGNGDVQVWGTISPETDNTALPLCKWDDSGDTPACKTDISWLLSSVGIYKELFDDAVANYYLRFHIFGLCYRFTKYQNADGAATCGDWIWEQGKNTKIAANEVCFDLKRLNTTTNEYDFLACAHQSPWSASRKMARRLQQHLDSNILAQRQLLQSVYGYQDRSDFISPARLYDDEGKDTDATWGGFFECRDVNKENKSAKERAQCWDETTGLLFGVDVPALRQVLQMIQNETRGETGGGEDSPWGGAMCHGLMDAAMDNSDVSISQSSTNAQKKAYCEGELNTFAIEERLNKLLGFGATLEEKKSLKREDDGSSFGGLRTLPKGGEDSGTVATGAPRALLAMVGIALALLAA